MLRARFRRGLLIALDQSTLRRAPLVEVWAGAILNAKAVLMLAVAGGGAAWALNV